MHGDAMPLVSITFRGRKPRPQGHRSGRCPSLPARARKIRLRARREKELSSFDETDEKLDLLATAVWHYLIVRESCGMYDHTAALAIFGVPPRVICRESA